MGLGQRNRGWTSSEIGSRTLGRKIGLVFVFLSLLAMVFAIHGWSSLSSQLVIRGMVLDGSTGSKELFVSSSSNIAIVVSFSYSPMSGYYVVFSGNVTGGTAPYTCSWNFGDGMGETTGCEPGRGDGLHTSHAYSTGGTYNVTLTVTDSLGATEIRSQSIIASLDSTGGSLAATLTADHIPITSGLASLFTASVLSTNNPTPPYSYSWDFGDAITGTSNPIYHMYSASGTFIVKVSITDSATPTPHTGQAIQSFNVENGTSGGGTNSFFGLLSSHLYLILGTGMGILLIVTVIVFARRRRHRSHRP